MELFLHFLVCLPSDFTLTLLVSILLCHVHHASIHNISDQEYLSVSSGTNCTKRELKIIICNPALHIHITRAHIAQSL